MPIMMIIEYPPSKVYFSDYSLARVVMLRAQRITLRDPLTIMMIARQSVSELRLLIQGIQGSIVHLFHTTIATLLLAISPDHLTRTHHSMVPCHHRILCENAHVLTEDTSSLKPPLPITLKSREKLYLPPTKNQF